MKILFVCTGNICRSSSAEAIARDKAARFGYEDFIFDSVGTSNYHEGESSDFRAVNTAKERGVSFDGITARQITQDDFENFDLIFCMDRSHLSHLYSIANPKYHGKIELFLQFCNVQNFWDDEVIDPYYGSGEGFIEVFDMLDKAIDNMFEIIS